MLTNQFLFLFIFLSYFVAHNEKFKEINQVNLFFSARMRVQKIVKHNLLVGHISQSFIISWRFKLLNINCNQRAESERIFCRSLFLFFLELSCSCFDCALKSFPTSHVMKLRRAWKILLLLYENSILQQSSLQRQMERD